MAETNDAGMLKVVLALFAIVSLVYGICYLIIPDVFISMSGSPPVDAGWIRWSGGTLIGLGIGAILVRRNPAKQAPFGTAITWGTLLTGLGLLYSWLTMETQVATWYIAAPTVIILGLAILLQISRQKAKSILSSG